MVRNRSGRPKKTDAFRRVPLKVQAAKRDGDRQAIRADALRRYARMQGGKPVMCTPPSDLAQARISAGQWDKKPKVIFKSLADAEAFAKIVAGLEGKTQVAYPCEYSRNGHAHLTTDD